MKSEVYPVVLPATLVVVMVAFLSVLFLACANPSFAASGKKKTAAVANISAVEHTETRIKQLQDALNLTADQDILWNNLTHMMRENAKSMDDLAKDRAENSKTMNAVERMKYHSQTTEVHLAQLNKIIPPFEALYSSMSDEQRKITDAIFLTGKHAKHKMKK
jgi:hypothetical protein